MSAKTVLVIVEPDKVGTRRRQWLPDSPREEAEALVADMNAKGLRADLQRQLRPDWAEWAIVEVMLVRPELTPYPSGLRSIGDVLRELRSRLHLAGHEPVIDEAKEAWHAAAAAVEVALRTYPCAMDAKLYDDQANKRVSVDALTVAERAVVPEHRRWVDMADDVAGRTDVDAVIAEAPAFPWVFDLDPGDNGAIEGMWTGKFYADAPPPVDCIAVCLYEDGPLSLAAIRFIEMATRHWPADRRMAAVGRAYIAYLESFDDRSMVSRRVIELDLATEEVRGNATRPAACARYLDEAYRMGASDPTRERDGHRAVLNRIADRLRVVHEDPKIEVAVMAALDERDRLRDKVRALEAQVIGLSDGTIRTMRSRAADELADEVAALVRRKVIDSRSPAADALLSFRDPPSTPRAERLADVDRYNASMAEWKAERATYRADLFTIAALVGVEAFVENDPRFWDTFRTEVIDGVAAIKARLEAALTEARRT